MRKGSPAEGLGAKRQSTARQRPAASIRRVTMGERIRQITSRCKRVCLSPRFHHRRSGPCNHSRGNYNKTIAIYRWYCSSGRIGRTAIITVLQGEMSKMRKVEGSRRQPGNRMNTTPADRGGQQGSGTRGLATVLLCLILATFSVLVVLIFSHGTLLCAIDRDQKLR